MITVMLHNPLGRPFLSSFPGVYITMPGLLIVIQYGAVPPTACTLILELSATFSLGLTLTDRGGAAAEKAGVSKIKAETIKINSELRNSMAVAPLSSLVDFKVE